MKFLSKYNNPKNTHIPVNKNKDYQINKPLYNKKTK